jgi:hypothetical protein
MMVYLATYAGEMADMLLQSGATTKKDQKTKKLHAYLDPVQMFSPWSAADGIPG